MLCPPVYITQAGGGVLAVAHITCATPSSVKRDSPVLPTQLLPAGLSRAYHDNCIIFFYPILAQQ